jgi:TM2 domain-containing membrane protein YozV
MPPRRLRHGLLRGARSGASPRNAASRSYGRSHGPPPAFAVPPPGGAATFAAPGSYAYSDVSPGLAFFLGCIPGVGAIYNGQYAKGIVHAVIWGMLMSICSSDSHAIRGMEPLFVIVVMAWWFYMAFEAYHTARKRRAGEPVDEYSSILNLSGHRSHVPVAGIALIAVGVLLLLHTLDLIDFESTWRVSGPSC